MQDLFRLLTSGARLKRKQPSNVSTTAQEQFIDASTPEIDFFSSSKKTSASTDDSIQHVDKRRRVIDQDKDDGGDEDGEEVVAVEKSAKDIRKDHRIRVFGNDIPTPITKFEDLTARYKLRKFIQRNLTQSEYTTPTPIQMQAIPLMLEGRQVMACAPTGSGKTLAFVLPILQTLKGPAADKGVRAVIVSPTRELAKQIHRQVERMSQGKPFKICVLAQNLNMGKVHLQACDILISTPLRLVNAIKEQQVSLHLVRHLILDEADKLLDMGFIDQVDEILAACTAPNLCKSLFSATIPSGVETLANTFMVDPVRIVIGSSNAATDTIKQSLLYVGSEEGKMIAIRQLIQQGIKPPVLIFVQSIDRARELFHELVYDGIHVDLIHAERTKAQRDTIVENFRQGRIWVLITTELMARGIDFMGVNLVINYDFPQTVQSYIHRIGRTGRAGRPGTAVTYFTKDDVVYLKSIVNVVRESGCDVPEWMLQLKRPSKAQRKHVKKFPIRRKEIKT
ncbi:hypothetical protein SmJEL517_g06222 [Synchytrium microbalum]|uniref:RNA helicase n=1 Tax=Synchytrium microbalum TaxID=1806994 RepID=A0A507BXR7_9FUNG|nr:uncharacterized protein SmJEL517_g06222 [Synchytrium microbalum]TPX30145.1 hypothetical protein SmJEL517_g06222 [Synchytrium microbalum]